MIFLIARECKFSRCTWVAERTSWGKVWVVFCAGSTLLLTLVVRPATSQPTTPLEVTPLSYWSIKPWFRTGGKLVDVLFTPSSWGSPTACLRTTSARQQGDLSAPTYAGISAPSFHQQLDFLGGYTYPPFFLKLRFLELLNILTSSWATKFTWFPPSTTQKFLIFGESKEKTTIYIFTICLRAPLLVFPLETQVVVTWFDLILFFVVL
jgi:hypothetical protein